MLVRCCPLLMTVPSFPSLSSSSPHCHPPPHHCPLLPITVPSCLFLLSRPSHHCPLLPITVSSFPSHHVIMAGCFSLRVFLLPPIWSVKKNSSCVLVKCTYPGGLPAVQVPGSVGTTWYGPGTLMNNVACTASHSPG